MGQPLVPTKEFFLGKGEILGVGGLDGQGQKELLLALFGVLMAGAVIALARTRSLFAVIVLSGVYSFLMATVLVMGNYTGYKLSELKRFKPLVDEMKSGATPGKDK